MAQPVRNYSQLAHDVLALVGGEPNIAQASRCATRLRLVLKETPPDAKEKVSELPGVITVVESGGQFQVVIGTHVGEVYDELVRIADVDLAGGAPKESILNRVIATMSAVFAPFVYILAGAGILQGALILINMAWGDFETTGTYEVLSFMSWTPFTFLPIFIAITASKHFKTNTFIAVLCCAAIINPTWSAIAARIAEGETVSFLGIALSETTYTSSVLPPLFLVWALSYLERFLSHRLPGTAKQLLTPLVCLVVMVPLTLLVIGPISAAAATGIADGYNSLAAAAPPVAGALIGAFWQVAVVFGVHWGITPVVLANFEQNGYDSFQAYQTAAVIAQVGAAVGVFLKTRNKQLKGVAGSASVTGLFGITEPAIYGVTLRFKKPFVLGCLAGAVGAVIVSLFEAKYYAYAGLPGPLTIVNAYSEGTNSLLGETLGSLVAFVGAAALVWFFGFNDPKESLGTDIEPEDTASPGTPAAGSDIVIASPLSGRVVPMADVPDPVFAQGAMGGGVAVQPTDGKVYAPFDGKVVTVLPTKHAIGLRSRDGVELLIHVGLDTVKLDGRGFTVHVKDQDQVTKGQLLLEFDRTVIGAAGLPLVTPLVVTNSRAYDDVLAETGGTVRHGDALITAVRAGATVDAGAS